MSLHPLKILRIERGWSRLDLARRAKLNPSTVVRVENYTHIPFYPTRRRLLRALDIPFARQHAIFGPKRS